MTSWPDVAVIMPVLEEEKYLKSAVTSILAQDYPGKLRIILSVGPSKDKTLQLAKELESSNQSILVINNNSGKTADGLNLAIEKCYEEIIVRVDAHSELSKNYIEEAVDTLKRTGADNVGGIMGATGVTKFEKAVAAAMRSKLGVGSAAFHVGGKEGPTESVYLGVFRKSALDRIGGFDPKFTRAQDWELNYRIRQTGGIVWFDPSLFVTYRPRPNIKKLASQYFQYGTWRRKVMQEHPESKKSRSALRYFAPPLAVIGVLLGLVLGTLGFFTDSLLSIGFIAPIGYLFLVFSFSILLRKKAEGGFVWLPLVLATMQLSWGTGFLIGRYFKIKN